MKKWHDWLKLKETVTGAETIVPGQITGFQSVVKSQKKKMFDDLMKRKSPEFSANANFLTNPAFSMTTDQFLQHFNTSPEEYNKFKRFGLVQDVGNNRLKFNLS